MQVSLHPQRAGIAVIDQLHLPADTDSAVFSLRSSLEVKAHNADLEAIGYTENDRERRYRLNRLPPDGKVQLSYEGNIASEGTKGTFDMPESILNQDGLYLDGASGWIPAFEDFPWISFSLQVGAPSGWELISQGKRVQRDNQFTFDMPYPQDEIYLMGAPYRRYSLVHNDIEIVVYLLHADADLADRYLQASAGYLSIYSQWIGRYPYAKFAVVENRWQTGYGMPSFTLLGSRVIRLPFILRTSLPHEIVHNWWGNGVFIDYSQGNWSEGLTAYMSDHYSDEQRGQGPAYRRKALERYANFAAEGRDFALADFRSRHDDASQAVGYSKSMMLFHMLRKMSGDDLFDDNIRRLWRRYQFQTADFNDVIMQLYPGDRDEAGAFIAQWLVREGAPLISLGEVTSENVSEGYQLSLQIKQEQAGPVYAVQVPLEVVLEGVRQPIRQLITLAEKQDTVTLSLDRRPLAVVLDPDYDVFRLLHPGERAATLSRLFGASRQLLVMPASATVEQKKAWQQLAAAWSRRYNNVQLIEDDAIKSLPDDAAVWLLGWRNRLLPPNLERLSSASQQFSGSSVVIDGKPFNNAEHGLVLLDPDNSRTPFGFIGADDADMITAMARKLPHYGSYGVLAFTRTDANNILKKRLPVLVSPMARQLARQK